MALLNEPAGQTVQLEARGTLNVPDVQFVQGVEPPGEYVPATQLVHVDCPGNVVKDPPGQVKQEEDDVAPAVEQYVPGPQAVQVEAFGPLNVPDVQFVHGVEPPGEYVPATQSVHFDCPDNVVKDPPGQVKHAEDDVAPAVEEYVPGPQAVQVEAFRPLNVPDVQFVQGVEPPGEYVPATQSVHVDCPGNVVKDPPGQVKQAEDDVAPAVGEYVPTPHAEQVPLPARE